MLSTRSRTALSSFEKQSLKKQWLRSGKCTRCFHASLRAEEGESTAPINKVKFGSAPKRGPTRKERATMISNEVSMLQQNKTSPYGKKQSSTALKDGEAGMKKWSQGPKQRVMSLETAMEAPDNAERPSRVPGNSPTKAATARPAKGMSAPSGTRFNPRGVSRDALLYGGGGTATIANGNFEGIIEDHLKAVIDPGQRGPKSNSQTAFKFSQNQLIRFETKTQTERIGETLDKEIPKSRKEKEKETEEDESEKKFERVPAGIEKVISERLVKGVYDADGILAGKQKYPQTVLNDISKQLLLNTTFLARDSSILINKVRSLLPAATGAPAKKAAKKGAA